MVEVLVAVVQPEEAARPGSRRGAYATKSAKLATDAVRTTVPWRRRREGEQEARQHPRRRASAGRSSCASAHAGATACDGRPSTSSTRPCASRCTCSDALIGCPSKPSPACSAFPNLSRWTGRLSRAHGVQFGNDPPNPPICPFPLRDSLYAPRRVTGNGQKYRSALAHRPAPRAPRRRVYEVVPGAGRGRRASSADVRSRRAGCSSSGRSRSRERCSATSTAFGSHVEQLPDLARAQVGAVAQRDQFAVAIVESRDGRRRPSADGRRRPRGRRRGQSLVERRDHGALAQVVVRRSARAMPITQLSGVALARVVRRAVAQRALDRRARDILGVVAVADPVRDVRVRRGG